MLSRRFCKGTTYEDKDTPPRLLTNLLRRVLLLRHWLVNCDHAVPSNADADCRELLPSLRTTGSSVNTVSVRAGTPHVHRDRNNVGRRMADATALGANRDHVGFDRIELDHLFLDLSSQSSAFCRRHRSGAIQRVDQCVGSIHLVQNSALDHRVALHDVLFCSQGISGYDLGALMKKKNLVYVLLILIAAMTALTGAIQVVAPAFILRLLSAEVTPTSKHFFAIVGMFMVLFGGATLNALLSFAHHPIVIFWSALQKLGASVAVGLGVQRNVFAWIALVVAVVDLLSGLLLLWYWKRIRQET